MTKNNLILLSRYFALGDNTDTTTFPDADALILLNAHYHELVVQAFQYCGDWELSGGNTQEIDITSSTRLYTLATDISKIDHVEIKYPPNATHPYVARKTTDKMLPVSKEEYVTGQPQFNLQGRKIEIFVTQKTADIQAVTGGITIYYQAEITELSGASDEPIIDEPFSRLLCLLTAKDFCGVNDYGSRINYLDKEIQMATQKFVTFYSNRADVEKLGLRVRKEDYGEAGAKNNYTSPNRSANWQ